MQGGFVAGLSAGLVADTAGLFTQGFSIDLSLLVLFHFPFSSHCHDAMHFFQF